MNRLILNIIPSELNVRAKVVLCAVGHFLGLAFLVFALNTPVLADTKNPSSPQAQTDSGKKKYEGRFWAEFPLIPEATIKKAGFILPFPESEGSIIQNYSMIKRFGAGTIVYIDIGAQKGVSPGDRFIVSRPEKTVFLPAKKSAWWNRLFATDIGYVINILGELEVLEVTAENSKAVILESYEEIMNGDRIMNPRTLSPLPPSREKSPEKNIEGYIIATKEPFVMISSPQIVFLDKGSEQQVAPGDRLEVYVTMETPDRQPLPPQVVADLIVVNTQEKTSTAVVLKSGMELLVGQSFRNAK